MFAGILVRRLQPLSVLLSRFPSKRMSENGRISSLDSMGGHLIPSPQRLLDGLPGTSLFFRATLEELTSTPPRMVREFQSVILVVAVSSSRAPPRFIEANHTNSFSAKTTTMAPAQEEQPATTTCPFGSPQACPAEQEEIGDKESEASTSSVLSTTLTSGFTNL